MLKEAGVEYVIVGHSERRTYFGETDQTVNLRALAALNAGFKTIICVGETLEQRELGVTMDWIRLQIKSDLAGVTADQVKSMVIAYEPIWAIGTGKTATTASNMPTTEETSIPKNNNATSHGSLFFILSTVVSFKSSSAVKPPSFA